MVASFVDGHFDESLLSTFSSFVCTRSQGVLNLPAVKEFHGSGTGRPARSSHFEFLTITPLAVARHLDRHQASGEL
jgi:hypothetical protein